MKKNLTLSIDAELLDRARVLAAMRRTSVNEMIRQYFEREIDLEAGASRADEWDAFFASVDASATEAQRAAPGGLPTRQEMYDEDMRERGLL